MTLEMQLITYEYNVSGTESQTFTPALDVTILAEYLTQSPPLSQEWTKGPYPGSAPVEHQVDNAVETLRIIATTSPFTLMGSLKQVLRRAQYWAEKDLHDRRVMVRVRDTARSATWYESRLWGGSIQLDRGPYLKMTLMRDPYWDAPEALVQVKNAGTSGAFANAAPIADRDDATNENYVIVDDVAGDLPTPLRLSVEDTTFGILVANLGELRVGWDTDNYAVNLEGENSLLPKTSHSSSAYSNGAYATAAAFYWSVSLQYSGPFKLLMKGDMAGKDWHASVGFGYSGSAVPLYVGETVPGVDGWTDLGLFVLPPGARIHPQRTDFYIQVDGTGNGDLDFLMMMPVYQFRKLSFFDARAASTFFVEDDTWRRETSIINSYGRSSEVDGYGHQIMLWPEKLLPDGANQMLVFTQEDTSNVVQSIRVAGVKVYARPRYEVLP